jgi:outer membrane protein OmpA-like peptidoglycan-associated protein
MMQTDQTAEVSAAEGHGGSYAVATWFLLIALVGLLAWYSARRNESTSPPPRVAEDSQVGAERGREGAEAPIKVPPAAGQGAGEETAALKQQLGEAKDRIARLEARLARKREQHAASLRAAEQDYADKLAAERRLWSQIAALGGQLTERGILLARESSPQFPTGKATLPAGPMPRLDRLAALLREHPKLKVRIEGHTDALGAAGVNLVLSQARAEAVKRALVERGVVADRIEAVGLGEARPLADGGVPAADRRNRRIEVYLLLNSVG